MNKFEEQVMGSLNLTIKRIAERNRIDEQRFNEIEKEQRETAKVLKKIKTIESIISDIQEKTIEVSDTSTFLSKSLPILLQVSICEALKKVLGTDYEE
jgi:septal ring factor EnvC (AmiA/AmiB activator)